jgi:hypothetical protein
MNSKSHGYFSVNDSYVVRESVVAKPCPEKGLNEVPYRLALIQDQTETRRWHCFVCGNSYPV